MLHIFPILVAGLSAIGTTVVIGSFFQSDKTVEPLMPSRATVEPPVRRATADVIPEAADIAALPRTQTGNKKKKNKKASAGAKRKQAVAASET